MKKAAGKNVRIDLKNIGRYDNWKALNPVYAEIPNLSDPKYFVSKNPKNGYEYVDAKNGPKIPKTKGLQHWHYITNIETKDSSNTLILRQAFTKDQVYIAMRPPYTPGLHKKYMQLLKRKGLEVHTAGKTKMEHPLNIVQIGGKNKKSARNNPCVVVYAREHADEHGSSHAASGIIQFLLSESELVKNADCESGDEDLSPDEDFVIVSCKCNVTVICNSM